MCLMQPKDINSLAYTYGPFIVSFAVGFLGFFAVILFFKDYFLESAICFIMTMAFLSGYFYLEKKKKLMDLENEKTKQDQMQEM